MSVRLRRLALAATVAAASALGMASPALALTKQSISFSPPASLTILQTPYILSATTSSDLPVTYTSNTLGVCTVTGNSLSLLAVGTCTITVSQSGDATYAAAASVTRSISVTKVRQTISFNVPEKLTLPQDPYTLAATASSGLSVSFASSTTSVCTVAGTTLTLVAVGTCRLTASQSGDSDYAAAASVTRSISVTKVRQTIAFNLPDSMTLPQDPYTLSATASSGLAVSFASSTTSVCTVAAATLTFVTSGRCTVTASQSGDAVTEAASVTKSISVAKLRQTIAFSVPETLTLPQDPYTLSATASSGLSVSFASSTSSVCTVAGSTLTVVAVGTCRLTASQSGDTIYAAAPTVARSISVTKAPQTIAFSVPEMLTLPQSPYALSATASSGLSVSFSASPSAVCTVAGSTLTLVAPGRCSIVASQSGDTDTAETSVTRPVSVTAVRQTIAFSLPESMTLPQDPYTLSATASSGLTVSFASSTSSVCTVAGTTLTVVASGTCTVTASQSGDADTAAASVKRSIAVTKTRQTIAFTVPDSLTLLQASYTLSATASSGLTVSFVVSPSAVCTVAGSTLTLVAVGRCTVVASQSGDADTAAATVKRSILITETRTRQTIAFSPETSLTLSETPYTLSATASSGLDVSFSSTTPSKCTVTGSELTVVAAGKCTVTASQAGDDDYEPKSVTKSIALTKETQTITFSPPTTLTLSEGSYALSATASSGLTVSFASATPSKCTVAGTTLTLLAAGTCKVTASQPGNAITAAAPSVTKSITITS